MAVAGKLKSVANEIKYIEAEIERRQAERYQPYIMILSDSDLQAMADETERGEELSALIEEYMAAGLTSFELKDFLYPQQKEPAPDLPPAPIVAPTPAPIAAQVDNAGFWLLPEAQPAPAPEPPPQNGVIRVRYNGEQAPGSYSLLCADGQRRPVVQGEVYILTEMQYENLKTQPAAWWAKV